MRWWAWGIVGLVGLAATPGQGQELWVGHQVVKGARSVPILGTLETRTDSYYLATVERRDGELRLVQRTCKMEVARFAGVQVSFHEEGVRKMPPSEIFYRLDGERWIAKPWITRWDREDVDGDGHPGATVTVEAPVCGGTLHVSGYSKARAHGVEAEGRLVGELRARVGHTILGTSGGCIGLVAKDSEESVAGTFAYQPAPEGTTCESLLASPWPVRAPEPEGGSPETKGPGPERRRLR